MFPYNVRNTNAKSGFTLPELMITLVVVGLLAAIGIPTFLQMLERFQTNSAFDQVLGAIKEAQLQAIRLGKTCTIKIDETATNKIDINNTANDQGCLLKPLKIDPLVSLPLLPISTRIKTNNDDGTVTFDFRGNPPNIDDLQTIVVFNKSANYRKCIVISNLIGMVRWGFYDEDAPLTNDPVSNLCDTQQ